MWVQVPPAVQKKGVKMSIKVIDNFLDKDEFNLLKNVLAGDSFPWFKSKILSEYGAKGPAIDEIENNQFCHLFYHNFCPQSNFINILDPIITKINPAAIIRIKANLNTKTDKIIEHGFHLDYQGSQELKTSIFYINTNDGYTLFENNEKIESVENRFLEFNSNYFHTGTSTTNTSARIVINFNYYK